jgi:hypothetical protein
MKAQSPQQERLLKTFDLERPDRPPILGGWLAAPEHVMALTGCSEDEYWEDPFHWGMKAEHVLGSDGAITIFTPVRRGAYRCVDHDVLEQRAAYTIESALEEIEALPTPEQIEAEWDEDAAYAEFAADFKAKQSAAGDILWCPADWGMIPNALWYARFGYEIALMLPPLYPDHHDKLLQVSARRGRHRAILHARALREGIQPCAILTGEDICSQQGPMISPEFLREKYFPLVEWVFEPFIEAGGKPIWHCDGNYRPILDDVLATGAGGLQGFQRECGMEIEWIVKKRTRTGDPLIIYGPMQVTTTLPHGTPEDIRAEVAHTIEICRDEASLAFFTSNTIIPDTPLENIRAYWDAVQSSTW